MGRHSRKGLEATGREAAAGGGEAGADAGPGRGRRRRDAAVPAPGDGHAPSHDDPRVRGGHPEQHEPGGGWGTGPQPRYDATRGQAARSQEAHARQAVARQLTAQQAAQRAATRRAPAPGPTAGAPLIPGPRREFVEAFDAAPPDPGRTPPRQAAADGAGTPGGAPGAAAGPDGGDGTGATRDARGGKGRTFTGIAAAAVTTVLAVVVAGQVAQDSGGPSGGSRAAGADRDTSQDDVSRHDERSDPQAQRVEAQPLSYAQKMAKPYPLAPDLTASGTFEAVPGLAKAPGKGHMYRYRIDVEKGLGLDAGLFAEAVQKTLNDDRSWAHNGAMTFERISSGEPDFVITLASPGTTALWCAKSGLDTTVDNVSCDSAATDRVMINAYRWAQGASTFGPDKLLIYRQMLINHEVGHRLGHNHESCRTPGSLAPVMQQQTKTLDLEGITCRPNPWVHPGT
ncbi:DUF3152 domain-containing protein [Streptomyces sp. NRRL WC-3549]|uniref:DUF3152 domain-containing protein n=1 Tax=Streptomyces sp. NRRL WC-3549 TaxID=1463925 RepID=UPI0004C7D0FB|nr:DUF3152 domain-containing protein [Streptomyces sp. NRRL WC-3549]